MTPAVKFFLVCCLLKGVWSSDWTVVMPPSVEGLSGSCVLVPCSFSLPSDWERLLDGSCRGVWKRGWSRTPVFDSGLQGDLSGLNLVQGNLTGNLQDKDCSTVFTNLPPDHYDSYYFRLECDNDLKFNFRASVLITTKNSLPRPTLTPAVLEVEEGSLVRLVCSAAAPCPSVPPAVSWTPALGLLEETMESQTLSSVMNFTASSLHNGLTLSCSSVYSRHTGTELHYQNSLTLRVLYPPTNTSVSDSGPVREGSSVTLTCSSDSNPAVETFTWYRLDGDEATALASGHTVSTTVSEDQNHFFCEVTNKYGGQNSSITQIDVLFPPKDTVVMVEPPGVVLEGSSISLLCSSRSNPPMDNYTWYKDDQELPESGQSLVIDGVDTSHDGNYHCAAKNHLGEETSARTPLDVQYPPKNTSVSVDPSGSVLDGGSVTLTCTAIANPSSVNITWIRAVGRDTEVMGSEQNFTFNVTKLSEDQYYCEASNVHGAQHSEPITVDVLFVPEILSSSRCVKMLGMIRCSCDSEGNPPPSLTWELAGESVNHSAASPIRVVPLGSMSMRSLITLHLLDEDTPPLVCHSVNSLGSDSFTFNVSSSESQLGFHTLSLGVGASAGALGMMLVCLPLLLIACRQRKGSLSPNKGLVDTSDVLVANGTNSAKVEVIHVHNTFLEEERKVEEDSLHYANVDFAKLQTSSEAKLGEGQIRGLASETVEYSEVRLHGAGDANKDRGTVTDSQLGPEKDTEHVVDKVTA